MGVMETGADGPGREAKHLGDLAGLVAHEVAEHEDRPFVGGEPPKATVELVAIGHAEELVGTRWVVDGEHMEVRRSPSLAAGLGDADVREEPVDPGIEAIGIAEVRQVTPGDHERILKGILRSIDVAEDPIGDREETVATALDQVDERRLISALGRLDEVAIHRLLLA